MGTFVYKWQIQSLISVTSKSSRLLNLYPMIKKARPRGCSNVSFGSPTSLLLHPDAENVRPLKPCSTVDSCFSISNFFKRNYPIIESEDLFLNLSAVKYNLMWSANSTDHYQTAQNMTFV